MLSCGLNGRVGQEPLVPDPASWSNAVFGFVSPVALPQEPQATGISVLLLGVVMLERGGDWPGSLPWPLSLLGS